MLRPLPIRGFLASFLLAIAAPVVLTACGGAGASGPAPTGTPSTPVDPAPTPTPTPTPNLDAQLLALARQANAGPMLPAPAQDPALVALGRALFFDRILSGNRDISCYTCHDVDFASGDGLSVSIGTGGFGKGAAREVAHGALIPRNAPPLFRLAGQPAMFRDSRVQRRPDGTLVTPQAALNGPNPAAPQIASLLTTALAAQAMFPVLSPDEMRGQPGENEIADAVDDLEAWSLLMRRLVGSDDGTAPGIAEYRDLFTRAYPAVSRWGDFNFGHAARAIAAFEVSAFTTTGAPFDAWLGGDASALTAAAKRGGILFYGRASCARCHGGPAFTDGRHHAIGVPQVGPGKDFPLEDTGRALVTGDSADLYRFRTPSLRDTAITGPWMHDGAYTTLEAAVRHYVDPVASLSTYDESQLSPLLRSLVDRDPLRQSARAAAIDPIVRPGAPLDDGEVADLLAFLGSLTDATASGIPAAEPARVPSGLPIDDADAP